MQWDYFDTWQHCCCHSGRARGQWSVYFGRNITCTCWNSAALSASLAVSIPPPVKLRPSRLCLDQKCAGQLGTLFFLWPAVPSPEGITSAFSFYSTFCTALHPSHWPWPSPLQFQVTPALCMICWWRGALSHIHKPKPEDHTITLRKCEAVMIWLVKTRWYCFVDKWPQTDLVSGKLPLGWSEGELCGCRFGTMKRLCQFKSCKTTGDALLLALRMAHVAAYL